jgi:ring-1,2-phenylacetyl-CoA epoxidase subunit PaaD
MQAIPAISDEQFQRLNRREDSAHAAIWTLLDAVRDPEIPVISIWELGILQDVRVLDDGHVEVVITPTYSGCPAMREISTDILQALETGGYTDASVRQQLNPAWCTEFITPEGHRKMREYGIASHSNPDSIHCPQCQSDKVERISEFGSTACKALYRCKDCLEPFDYFKPL